ncbi:MAG: TRAP transporter TatT component family protein, partial [Pseudomonadota bacterium]
MTRPTRRLCIGIFFLFPLLLTGCAGLISSATDQLAASLTGAVLDNNDPATVEDGLPAYLLLIDGLLKDNPESESLLLSAANLNGSYAGGFVLNDPPRAMRLTDKALTYATRAMCVRHPDACE